MGNKIPLKVRIFLWQWVRGRLPLGTEIQKRNGPGNSLCPICLVPEDCNHIFFWFPAAQFLWSCFTEVVGGNWRHDNLPDLFEEVLSLPGPRRPPIWVALGTLAWTLWCCRNKLVIEHVIPCRVAGAIYKMCGFL